MPDDKIDGLASDDDDPFEGVEISADAPEPTQEEMDEWATLDTPDEGGSPLSTRHEAKPGAQAAAAPPAPAASTQPAFQAAAAPSKPTDKKEEDTKKDKQETAPTPPASAPPAESPNVTSNSSASAAPVPIPEKPAVVTEAAPAPAVGLSEISPSQSPEPSRSGRAKSPANKVDSAENPVYLGGDGKGAEETESQHARPQHRPQQQQSGGSWGGGWGAGWGLGALGGKLREVAAGAVRDVKELSESFQAALADVTGAEEEVERAGLLSAMDRAAESSSQGAGGSAGGAAQEPEDAAEPEAADGVAALPTDAPRQATEPARASLHLTGPARSAGRGVGASGLGRSSAGGSADAGGGGSPPADPALEAGLQAIDAQVEQLATGAARAISSLWGGLSSVAKVVAAEVVASVADVQSSEAVRGVAQIGSKLAHTAERGLETVGRTAMTLLEEVAGVGGGLPGRRRIWGEEADARAADMGREPSSFQDFFYIYGGEQLAEEVNNLSNECSHLCNRSRSKLEADQQQALDEALARLGPYFNDPWVAVPRIGADAASADAAAAPAAPPAPALAEASKEAAERLGHMYDPIGYLCQDSQSRSEAYLHQLVDSVEAARQEGRQGRGLTAAAKKRAAARQRKAGAGEERQSLLEDHRAGEAASAAAAADEEGDGEEYQPLTADPRLLLESFRAHFTKRMAEVATAQLQLLLNLGASLAAPARTGRPAVDGISWPDSSEQQAALLAGEAQRMVADLATIADAYRATIAALREHLQKTPEAPAAAADAAAAKAAEPGAEAEAKIEEGAEVDGGPVLDPAALDELDAALQVASKSAAASIKSGYKGLLYAVLLRSLVTHIAQQREEEGEEEGAEEARGVREKGAGEQEEKGEEETAEGGAEEGLRGKGAAAAEEAGALKEDALLIELDDAADGAAPKKAEAPK